MLQNSLLHSPLFTTKTIGNDIILLRKRSIPRIPLLNKIMWILIARVTMKVSLTHNTLTCQCRINPEAVFGLILVLIGICLHFMGTLVAEDISSGFVFAITVLYFFFLIREIVIYYRSLKSIVLQQHTQQSK